MALATVSLSQAMIAKYDTESCETRGGCHYIRRKYTRALVSALHRLAFSRLPTRLEMSLRSPEHSLDVKIVCIGINAFSVPSISDHLPKRSRKLWRYEQATTGTHSRSSSLLCSSLPAEKPDGGQLNRATHFLQASKEQNQGMRGLHFYSFFIYFFQSIYILGYKPKTKTSRST